MSKHTLIVSFPALRGYENVHRIRNLAEDIYRHFRHNRRGVLEEMDDITNEMRVFIHKPRFLGHVLGVLNDELKKHNLFEDAIITKYEGVHYSKTQ